MSRVGLSVHETQVRPLRAEETLQIVACQMYLLAARLRRGLPLTVDDLLRVRDYALRNPNDGAIAKDQA